MSVGPVLSSARAAFERRMRGTCTITRPSAEPVTDANGYVTYPETAVYEGRCYVRYPGLAFEQSPEFGGATSTVSRLVLRIPFGSIVRPGDLVTITADPDNPQLAGTRLGVASVDDQSQASAQRILCEDFQAGATLGVTP